MSNGSELSEPMSSAPDNFRYLNREGKWLDFHLRGLEVSPEGELRLLSSPALINSLSISMSPGVAPTAPAGIAVDESGRRFYSIPDEDRIVVTAGCDPEPQSLRCLTETPGLGTLSAPRGLLVLEKSQRLVIADSGNDRLVLCDLNTFEVREVWDSPGLGAADAPVYAPARFSHPRSVASDRNEENLFILDASNRRVIKFSRTGDFDSDFAYNLINSGLVPYPSALAVGGSGADTCVYVSDLSVNAIFVFDATGNPVLNSHGLPVSITHPGMGSILALAVSESSLFVGDNVGQRILCFSTEGSAFCGDATGFRGYVTALAFDKQRDELVALRVGSGPPLTFSSHGSCRAAGVLWSEAISAGKPVVWGRLQAWLKKPAGAHIEFFYATKNKQTPPPVDPDADNPFSNDDWKPLPRDVDSFLLTSERVPYLFLGAQFLSDRSGSASLSQLRVDFDRESYVRFLPEIYRDPEAPSVFVRLLVSLLQSEFEDVEKEVETLERYFDPWAAPIEALPWLAGWLAVELDRGQPQARIRHSIANAFDRYRWRGTIAGLRLALLEDAGVHAVISEPISNSAFWAMPAESNCSHSERPSTAYLGAATHLTSTEPGGAVLGRTAQLDHSYLITDAEFGEPLFIGAASQFIVEVYRAEVNTPARLALVKEIIEREKPAHTMYRLSFIDSTMRVGSQSRAGVDSIVSGMSGATPLGQQGASGLRLSGSWSPRIGISRLGQDLKI